MTDTHAQLHQALLKHGVDFKGSFQQSLIWETPVKIYSRVNVMEVEFGAYSYVAPYTELNYVKVGRYCSIGPYCRLFGSAHPTGWLSSHPFTHQNIFKDLIQYDTHLSFEGYDAITEIGHDVWIGTNAIVIPGTKVGNGAVIGAGAVVAKDVPDYAVVVGNPARVVKYRFDEAMIERLLKAQWWRFDMPRLMAARKGLPFDRPEAMLDLIEKEGAELPLIDGTRKMLFEGPQGLAVKVLRSESALKDRPEDVSPSPPL